MVTFHSERLETEEDITLQGAVTRSHTSEPNDYKYGFTLATLIILQDGKVSIHNIPSLKALTCDTSTQINTLGTRKKCSNNFQYLDIVFVAGVKV